MKLLDIKGLIILIVIILIISCSRKKNDATEMEYVYNEPSIKISKDVTPLNLDLQEITELSDFYHNLDSIKIVSLETNRESIIGRISSLFIINDTIFVADYLKTKSIFAFDLQGNYLYKINKVGSGPGEYNSINMVHIDSENIVVLDWDSWKIIKYDLQGNLIYEQKSDYWIPDFMHLNDNEFILAFNKYTDVNQYQIEFTNDKLVSKDTAFPFRNTRSLVGSSISRFQKLQEDNILYYYNFCDTIFEIKDKHIYPKYNLSLYKPKEVQSFYARTKYMNQNDFITELRENNIISDFLFFELKNNLFIQYAKGHEKYVALVSKKSANSYISIASDVRKKTIDLPFVVCGHSQNALLSFIDGTFVFSVSEKDQKRFHSHLSDENITSINTLNDIENNPVLCIMYIKDLL